jgi:hypothetical protein
MARERLLLDSRAYGFKDIHSGYIYVYVYVYICVYVYIEYVNVYWYMCVFIDVLIWENSVVGFKSVRI